MEVNQAQKLLLQLRDDYLGELPATCDKIENLVLSLPVSFEGNFEELYRRVHSVKGSAGTHGLMIISAICHDLEGQLTLLAESGAKVPDSAVEMLLRYVDLIRKAQRVATADNPDFSETEKELEQIRQSTLQDLHPVMLVESSEYVKLLCKEALADMPVKLTVEENGLNALGHLLRSRYSALIIANEAKALNGLAVIGALRASDSINKKIKTVLLTSRTSLKDELHIRPDYVVNRNAEIGDNLPQVVKEIINTLKN